MDLNPTRIVKFAEKKRMGESDMVEYRKEYVKNNRDRLNGQMNEYQKNLYQSDELFRLKSSIRNSVLRYLKDGKSKSTQEILGCSWEFLQTHLDTSGFYNPHYDHIVPLSWAENEDEVYALNHWSNFQVLESEDNRKKGNRYCLKSRVKDVLNNHKYPNKVIDVIKNNSIEKKGRYVYFKYLTEQ